MSVVRRRFIAPVSFGLGDLVVSLPVVQAAVNADRCSDGETWLVTRSQSQAALAERVSGLAGTVAEGDAAINPETYIDLRDHPLQRDHWWGTPEFVAAYGHCSINEIIAQIGADFGVVGDFSEPFALEAQARPDAEGLVLFVADTDGAAKRWAPERWVGLANGARATRVSMSPWSPGTTMATPWSIAGWPVWSQRLLVRQSTCFSACRAVVGVDTGLTHIAAQQRTPDHHPFPEAGRLLQGLGSHPSGHWICMRSAVPTCREGVCLQPASRPDRGTPGAACVSSRSPLPGCNRTRFGVEGARRALLMDSLPVSRVVNSQPAGIGRLVAFGSQCAWNNLGRNVVFADTSLRPLAIFGETLFPEDDEASQFDLDIHAIVALGGTGTDRRLEPSGIGPDLRATVVGPGRDRSSLILTAARRLDFVDDVERVVGLGDRLVTSRPRGQRLGGVLVTEPVPPARRYLDAVSAHESFGFVTALAGGSTPNGTGWVAMGGEGRVRLIEAESGRLGAGRWETAVPFMPAALVASGSSLWAAGSAVGGAGVDDYDWEQLGGGGLAQLDLATGVVMSSARFGHDLAWGSGGVPLVVVDDVPCGVGRRGELYGLAPGAGVTAQLTSELAPDPLGIAHAAVVSDQLVIGFNRGGYRLHAIPVSTVTQLVRDLPVRRA